MDGYSWILSAWPKGQSSLDLKSEDDRSKMTGKWTLFLALFNKLLSLSVFLITAMLCVSEI